MNWIWHCDNCDRDGVLKADSLQKAITLAYSAHHLKHLYSKSKCSLAKLRVLDNSPTARHQRCEDRRDPRGGMRLLLEVINDGIVPSWNGQV